MSKIQTKLHKHPRVCENCGEAYFGIKADSQFCGRSCSISWRNKNRPDIAKRIGESLKKSEKFKQTIIKSHSAEANEARSKATKQQWEDRREEMVAAQKQAYIDNPQICIDRQKKNLDNPEWHKNLSIAFKKLWAENKDEMIRKCILPTLNTFNSKLEQKYEKYLTDNNINYQKQYVLEGKVYDFYLPDIHTLIEIDGRYWHPEDINDGKEYSDRQKQNFENDKLKDEIAEKHGFKIERIRE